MIPLLESVPEQLPRLISAPILTARINWGQTVHMGGTRYLEEDPIFGRIGRPLRIASDIVPI